MEIAENPIYSAKQRLNFPLIDILRGVAALWVVFYHVLALKPWPGFPTTGLASLPRYGWSGVDLFFVISGFVIGKTVLDAHTASQQSGLPWRRLYAERRLRRIVPLYLATAALYVVFFMPTLMWDGWNGLRHIGSHVLFVHNIWHETHGSINSPSWSVGLEMQFYLLMAFAAPWLARSGVVKIVLVWLAVGVGWRYGSTLVFPPGSSSPIIQFIYSSQLPGTLDEFVCGIAIAKLLQAGQLRFTPTRFALWAMAALVLLSAAWVTVPDEGSYWQSVPAVVGWRTLAAMAFAAVLGCVVMLPVRSAGQAQALLKPLCYFGTISYGIYLWHMPVLHVLIEKSPFQGPRLLAATVLSTVVLASLSWYGFEKLWLTKERPAS
jgi:peptidoglycan/LPS O-acetylase OafA/YrhL